MITGKVLDSEGDPIPSVSVQAFPARPGSQADRYPDGFASSNDLGEYRLSGLRPGSYLVVANPSSVLKVSTADKRDPAKGNVSYVRTYYPGTIDKAQAVPVELHPGDETPINLTPLTSPTFSIRGTIAKPPGAKFGQLFLRSSLSEDIGEHSQQLREDGAFDFESLVPGSYTAYMMVIDLASFAQTQPTQRPQMQMMRLGQPIEVSNANVEGLHLVPESPGTVRGRFRMDKEEKIDWSQLQVLLRPEDSSAFTSGMFGQNLAAAVQRDGSFEMKDVSAGSYRLAVTSSSTTLQDYITKSINLEGKDVGDTGFPVSGGIVSLDVVVSAHGATIDGTVVDYKGLPVADATVVAAPNGERRKRFDLFGRQTSDAQGHFTLRGLNPGESTLFAWEDPEGNPQDLEFLKTVDDRGQKIQLEEGIRKTIVVKVISTVVDTP